MLCTASLARPNAATFPSSSPSAPAFPAKRAQVPTEPGLFSHEIRQRPTLPRGDHVVPSALEGLTAVFGMGTGVTPPLLPPEAAHVVRDDLAQDSAKRADNVYG